jgi:hypothetical protein
LNYTQEKIQCFTRMHFFLIKFCKLALFLFNWAHPYILILLLIFSFWLWLSWKNVKWGGNIIIFLEPYTGGNECTPIRKEISSYSQLVQVSQLANEWQKCSIHRPEKVPQFLYQSTTICQIEKNFRHTLISLTVTLFCFLF